MKNLVSTINLMRSQIKELGFRDTNRLQEVVASYSELGRKHNLPEIKYNAEYLERQELKLLLSAKKRDQAMRFKDAVTEFDKILADQIRRLE
jgi:hypothetical protein